jgi:hypothetical protein
LCCAANESRNEKSRKFDELQEILVVAGVWVVKELHDDFFVPIRKLVDAAVIDGAAMSDYIQIDNLN